MTAQTKAQEMFELLRKNRGPNSSVSLVLLEGETENQLEGSCAVVIGSCSQVHSIVLVFRQLEGIKQTAEANGDFDFAESVGLLINCAKELWGSVDFKDESRHVTK